MTEWIDARVIGAAKHLNHFSIVDQFVIDFKYFFIILEKPNMVISKY